MLKRARKKKPGRLSDLRVYVLTAVVLAALLLAGCGGEGESTGAAQEDGPTTVREEVGGGEPTTDREPDASAGDGSGWPVEEVAAQVEPSVVQVNTRTIQTAPFGPEEAQGLGSGVIYRQDGFVITNAHVVEGAGSVNVAFADGTTEQGEVVGADPYTDLAVVRVDRDGLPAARFGDSGDLAVGELAVAVGSPSGFQSTVTSGVISGLGREVPAGLTGGRQQTALVDLIQTDAAISPGSSGGALANGEGEVVGINVAYLPPSQTGAVNIGFAIPSDTATSVAAQLVESGEATQPYLGVSATNLTPEIAQRFGLSVESGALITAVDPDGPAAEAGIEPPAVITAVASRLAIESGSVRTVGDLLSVLRQYRPGETVALTVAKDGEEREIEVELGERSE